MRRFTTLFTILVALVTCVLVGCTTDANVVSENLSKAADQFEVTRRVVFYNGITGEYMLEVTGLCSLKADRADNQLELTVKVGPNEYKKHYLGLSDNVTYFAEQVDAVKASKYFYRVVFKPTTILPNIDIR